MTRRLIPSFALLWLLSAAQMAGAQSPLPPASEWLPENTVLALEVAKPEAILDVLLDPKMVDRVTSLPQYHKAAEHKDFMQMRQAVAFLEVALGTNWQTALRKLTGGGITLAVAPKDHVLLVVDSQDAKMLQKLHEVLLGFAKGEAEKQGKPESVNSADYRGVTGWTFAKNESHAIVGNRLLMANRPETLKAAIDLRAEPDKPSLANSPAYQAAKKAAGTAAASLFVNLDAVKRLPQVDKALSVHTNPMAALLFGDIIEALRGSSWLAMGLSVDGKSFGLQATVDGKPAVGSEAAAFAWPTQAGDGAFPCFSVPRSIASFSVYRDLHAFYAAKDKLFPERTSGLILFENMMGIFFTGRDLTSEVLAETRPEFRFVVAQQNFDPALGTPQLQLPAFAAIFRLKHADKFAEIAEEAWQKAIGLVSFTRGQKAQQGLIISHATHAGNPYSLAHFSAPANKDKTGLDAIYNFRPALARVGDFLVLSSTDGLAKDLIDALKKELAEQVKAVAASHSMLEIDAAQLASILQANRKNLVRQNMVEKGNTQEQAEGEADIIVTLLKSLGRASLQVGSKNGQTQATLKLKPDLR